MAQDTPEVPREPQPPSEPNIVGLVLRDYIRELTEPVSVSEENGKNIRRNKYGVVVEAGEEIPENNMIPGICYLDADLSNKQGIEFIEGITFSSAPSLSRDGSIDSRVFIDFDENHPSNFTLTDTDEEGNLYLRRRYLLQLVFFQNGRMYVDLSDERVEDDDPRLKDEEFLSEIVKLPGGHLFPDTDYRRINDDPKTWQELLIQIFDRLSKAHPGQYPDFNEYLKNFGKVEQPAESIVDIPTDPEDPPASGGFIRPRNKR